MGFRNCAFISLRILEAIVAILTLTFAIYSMTHLFLSTKVSG